jgi:hypothetical protein
MALAQIEKQFGKGSVMRMGEKTSMAIEAIPTGALALDIALGVGGLPRGRVTEIYGPESSGKSTLAMHVVAEAQRNGGICAYIDAEHAMDPIYAAKIGVDIDQLLISQPDTGEQALEITDMLVRSGALDVSSSTRWPRSRPGPRSRARWATPTSACRPASCPGAAQAHRQPQQDQHHLHLHQPAAREDRRDVRLARDHAGGRALKFYSSVRSTSAASSRSRTVPRSSATAPGSRSSRTRWPRRSSRPSSTSCTARASAVRARCSTWASTWAS